MTVWSMRADLAQQSLNQNFWNHDIQMYNIEIPCPNGECNTIFHYWWMAHAVEILVDGYERTRDKKYLSTLNSFYEGIYRRNQYKWINDLYDDMEWMAIAWLRAYDATNDKQYLNAVNELWTDIKTGWNDLQGGGIAWQKSQLDYKNTPANAPAIILAARLYQRFNQAEDLEWAVRIFTWLQDNLVNPIDGFVWDGKNRKGDGLIDKDWEFTYCQGIYIGASCELYQITNNQNYLDKAHRTARIALSKLSQAENGILPNEGLGDGGLFKGILIRYLAQLIHTDSNNTEKYIEFMQRNGNSLWNSINDETNPLFGPSWSEQQLQSITQLSTHLSGVILTEALASFESIHDIGRLPSLRS